MSYNDERAGKPGFGGTLTVVTGVDLDSRRVQTQDLNVWRGLVLSVGTPAPATGSGVKGARVELGAPVAAAGVLTTITWDALGFDRGNVGAAGATDLYVWESGIWRASANLWTTGVPGAVSVEAVIQRGRGNPLAYTTLAWGRIEVTADSGLCVVLPDCFCSPNDRFRVQASIVGGGASWAAGSSFSVVKVGE